MRNVLLLGATGLVGRELLSLLLGDDSVARVTAIVRRATGATSPKLDEHIVDLPDLAGHPELFAVDQIFCALGTTIRKAGSEENFRRVDFDAPLEAARLGLARGARHYLLVSSVGANAGSRTFYTRVKGELEEQLMTLGYPTLSIARPSLLLGPRTEKRRGEEIAKRFGWLMPPAYKPIEARTVARALVASSHNDAPGVRVLDSKGMRQRFG